MRIALMTFRLSGGAFAHGFAALSKGLWELGIKDQHVIYLKEGPGRDIHFPEGVRIIRSGINRSFLLPIWLARFLQNDRPDVLITMPVFLNLSGIFGKLFAGGVPTKLIISERATLSYKVYVENRNEYRWHPLPWLVRHFYPYSDGLVANSDEVLEDLLTNFRIKIDKRHTKVIPPAIDIEMVRSRKLEMPALPWHHNKDKPVIVSVGRLAVQKNFTLLLKSFAIVRNELDARLIILGEGPEREKLIQMISDLELTQVYLPGYCENPWSIMARSDVFVLSSQEEAFGRVLVEAMACGLPVIATDAIGGGPRRILADGQNGILIPTGDEQALAEAIISMLNSTDLRRNLSIIGEKHVESYSPKNNAEQWLSFINMLNNNYV